MADDRYRYSHISHEEYERIREVCRENIESLHNLVFLLRQHREQPDRIDHDATVIEVHLETITNALCRQPSKES
jgi:hypothetical protein